MIHKKVIPAVIIYLMMFGNAAVFAEDNDVKNQIKTGTRDDKISYAIGYDVSQNLKEIIDFNTELFLQGVNDGLADQQKMSRQEVVEAIKAYQMLAKQRQMAAREKQLADNKAAGEKFLAANKKNEGVIELPSGLQYKVIRAGNGDSPKPGDKVRCHYKGTLINGSEFDSSYERNKPVVFPVDGVIKGWTQALQLMKVGGKWQVYIPSDLAYGDRGAGNIIAPGSALIFEIELLSIEEAAEGKDQG